MTTGTHDISTLLATNFQSVVEYGEDRIIDVLNADNAAHNAIVQDLVGSFCEFTTDRHRRYGSSIEGEMMEVDEYGRAPTQVAKPGSTVGFPMRMFQFNIGWTDKWLQNHTPADMAIAQQNAQKSHFRNLQTQIKRSIFGSANYTYTDHLVDNVDLAVKRFVNADGQAIPDGPHGEKFDGTTHTHYMARAGGSLVKSDVTGLIDDVVEHGHGGDVKIAIARADETTFKGLTGFTEYSDARIVYNASDVTLKTADYSRLDNRAIGILDGAEVWVKPWGIANYAFAWDMVGPKPLAFRQRSNTALQGLRIAAENRQFPLLARYMEVEFGVGVWERTNGAVLYFGNTTYADPTIN